MTSSLIIPIVDGPGSPYIICFLKQMMPGFRPSYASGLKYAGTYGMDFLDTFTLTFKNGERRLVESSTPKRPETAIEKLSRVLPWRKEAATVPTVILTNLRDVVIYPQEIISVHENMDEEQPFYEIEMSGFLADDVKVLQENGEKLLLSDTPLKIHYRTNDKTGWIMETAVVQESILGIF